MPKAYHEILPAIQMSSKRIWDTALRREARSRNTRENAVNVKRLLDEENLETVILVTSALHMPRAPARLTSTEPCDGAADRRPAACGRPGGCPPA